MTLDCKLHVTTVTYSFYIGTGQAIYFTIAIRRLECIMKCFVCICITGQENSECTNCNCIVAKSHE